MQHMFESNMTLMTLIMIEMSMMIILETIHKKCASSHKEALVVVDAAGTVCTLALLCEMDFDEFCQAQGATLVRQDLKRMHSIA